MISLIILANEVEVFSKPVTVYIYHNFIIRLFFSYANTETPQIYHYGY